MSSDFTQSDHVRMLADSEFSSLIDRAEPAIRWVDIGGKAFGFTPNTCYNHILSKGGDYHPYYDDDLTTIHNLDDYPSIDVNPPSIRN